MPAGLGDTVAVDYEGRLEDGTVFDSSADRAPLLFTIGAGDVLPLFEQAVIGLEVGESATVTIPPQEAYGVYYEEGRQMVPVDVFGGPADTDLGPLLYPATAATQPELVAGISADATTSLFSTLAVWGTDAADAAPRSIIGPRVYLPEETPFTSGLSAVGDIDDDGANDVVVSDAAANQVAVFSPDALKGLSSYDDAEAYAVGGTATQLGIADVIDDASGRPEVLVIAGSTLYVYRYDTAGSPLQSVGSVAGLGTDITGLAAGDLDGDGFAELVVTDADAPAIHILDGGTGSLVVTTVAAKAGVRGPSIGDVDSAAGVEFAVANADEAVDQVTVYDATGTEIDSASLPGVGTAKAWATLVADVLPGATPAGAELAVAANGADGDSYVVTFERGAGVIGPGTPYATGPGFGTGSLAAGDIDGDTYAELIAGNGGFWSGDPALATPPSVQVFHHDAQQDAFDTGLTETLFVGGVERAGAAPTIAVADLGGVGPSRHPVGAVADAHAVDEAAPAVRHVECVDCHNSHEATSTVGVAPAAYGRILGTNGATAALADAKPITDEFELCYKCHSAYQNAAGLEGSTDISALFDSGNASMHAVEAAQTTAIDSGTFEGTWTQDSVLYCIDCHATAEASPAVAGPHTSAEAPILRSPYLGVAPSNPDGLCYDCHKYSVYYSGGAGSAFVDGTLGELHERHVKDQGFGCATCHASHGAPDNERLIRGPVAYIDYNAATRTCVGACHPAPGKTYTP